MSYPAARVVFLVTYAAALVLSASGCAPPQKEPKAPIVELRRIAPASRDPEVIGRWLLAEMIEPDGSASGARNARKRLDALAGGTMLGELARGYDDVVHGRPRTASNHFMEALKAARASHDERAPLFAWFAAHHAVQLDSQSPGLWKHWKAFVERAIEQPSAIGWRARSELVEWALNKAWEDAEADLEERAVKQFGCLTRARLAGPFGRGTNVDAYQAHRAEAPGPWPARFARERGASVRPKVLAVKPHGCGLSTEEPTPDGVYYVESFFELPEDRDVIVAVQGALAVRVDDQLVLDRDIRNWGVWPRFGVRLSLARGRHRIVARLGEPSSSIRIMHPDGRPLSLESSDDPAPPYGVRPVRPGPEPNELMRFIEDERIVGPNDPVLRFVAAYLAHVESSDDVANVMLEPLLKDLSKATGPVLSQAALFAEGDPIFDSTQSDDLSSELSRKAVEKDPDLWTSALVLALGQGRKKGLSEAIGPVATLFRRFPQVSTVGIALARIYGELGWTAEQARTVKELVKRFPNDLTSLHAAVDVYDREGNFRIADALVARIERIDRDSEVLLSRALARRDYDTALAELRRLIERRPEQKELAERVHDVMVRAGNDAETWKKLEAAVEKDPRSGRARLELADAAFSRGDHDALVKALAGAVENGADTTLLSTAIDVVEGSTALEPYRLDPMPIIEEYEASGRHMPGTAARVLDYAALWVRSDGSSQMLEHELVRLQSEEAIANFAEHRRLEGLVLRMRVIKKDGTTLEPESIAGKPTVTFPHLEVGDYIETEQVVFNEGDGLGRRYLGPRWFFREEKIAYARSEFVLVTPRHKNVIIETTGKVPPPTVTNEGNLVTRRFRVDFSEAAPTEPNSAPITEFLPSVRPGWGITLEDRLENLADAVAETTPVDPRIVRIAERIAESAPKRDTLGRAKRLYRWVLDNVEEGEENDGRRVIVAKRGNRWRGFLALCRALDIDARYAVAQNRLASPPVGPHSRAGLFSQPVLRLSLGKDRVAWLTLNNKYAPFGYVPAEIRGMPAYVLDGAKKEPVTLPSEGAEDGLAFEGSGKLKANGALELELIERFNGKLAMALRNGLAQLPERQVRDAVESNLLGRMLPGARLEKYTIVGRDDLDAPLVVKMHVLVDRFARVQDGALVVTPPFVLELSALTALPARQTPLLLGESVHREVNLSIELPARARVQVPPPVAIDEAGRRFVRKDGVTGSTLNLTRTLHIPAGRIKPEEYAAFARFAARVDAAQSTALMVRL